MDVALFIFITILQIAIGLIASLFKLSKGQEYKFPTNLTFFGWTLFVCVILCIGLSITSFYLNKSSVENFESKLFIRDSINKLHIDSVHFKNVELLAKYSLKIDTNSQEVIKILKDSIYRNKTIFNGPDPYFSFYKDSALKVVKLSDSLIKVNAYFTSNYSLSRSINAKLSIVFNYNGQFKVLKQTNLFVNSILDNGIAKAISFTLPINASTLYKINTLYFYLSGNYYNNDLTKKFKIDDIAVFDFLSSNMRANSFIENEIKTVVSQY